MARIAVITTSYPADRDDASGHFVRAEVSALERAGNHVEVFVPKGPAFGWPGVAARVRERPWRVHSVPMALVRTAQELRAAGRFERTIAHFAIPSAWPLAEIMRPAHRGELEVVSHGGDVRLLARLPHALRQPIVRTLLAHAHRWRFPSAALYQELACVLSSRETSALERLAAVIAPALELPDIEAERAAVRAAIATLFGGDGARSTPPPPLWIAAARLVPSKRIDWAIAHAHAHGAHLIVIGDGPEQPRLEAQARAAGAPIHFLGRLPRRLTLAWIAQADALVHASEAEGLSSVVREAQALGTRVIVRDAP